MQSNHAAKRRGGPNRVRTYDSWLRRPILFPTELWSQPFASSFFLSLGMSRSGCNRVDCLPWPAYQADWPLSTGCFRFVGVGQTSRVWRLPWPAYQADWPLSTGLHNAQLWILHALQGIHDRQGNMAVARTARGLAGPFTARIGGRIGKARNGPARPLAVRKTY